MILVDMNQVMISNVMVQIGNHHNVEFEESLIRHMVLNSIRSYRRKFVKDYGELVLCFDDKNYWRRDIFPYYKANRKKSRETSELNWNELFRILNLVRDELKEIFPYKTVQVDRAEADDAIGTICHKFGVELNAGSTEKILILSADKDFIQLHKYANVTQYDPIRKRWIRHANPNQYIMEHIMKGDAGDGVPNMLSADDCFVMGSRQKPMTRRRIEQFMDEIENDCFQNEYALRGYQRNKAMIDLSMVPEYIQEEVMTKYNEESGDRSKLFNYFIEKRLKNLIENIGEF